MRKRLIIALDFSSYTQNLLEYARNLTMSNETDVLLVHHSTVMAPSLADAEIRKEISKRTNVENLAKLRVMAQEAGLPASSTRYQVSEEHLMMTLERLVEEPYDQLLLMGVKGTGGLKRIFLGSNVVAAIEHLSCKVLALPKAKNHTNPNKFLVGIHPRYPLNQRQLDNLIDFYKVHVKSLVFFSVLTTPDIREEVEENLAQVAKNYQQSYETQTEIVLQQDVNTQTKALLDAHPDSLLVLQRGSRYISDLVFRKMLINDLVYEGKVALAVLP